MIFENCSSEEHHKTYEDFYYEHIKQINSLKQQLKEANEVIEILNNKATGREYGLDAEDIWEISKIYIEKYGSET
jgi:hypothetical protein